MVVGRTSALPRLHGGSQPVVVIRGQGKLRPGTLRGYSRRYTAPSYYDYYFNPRNHIPWTHNDAHGPHEARRSESRLQPSHSPPRRCALQYLNYVPAYTDKPRAFMIPRGSGSPQEERAHGPSRETGRPGMHRWDLWMNHLSRWRDVGPPSARNRSPPLATPPPLGLRP